MRYIEIKAPAKINIGLNIVGKRDDGYHNLETFFFPIYDLFDVLTFERADVFLFNFVQTHVSDIIYQERFNSNLIVKAKDLLEETVGKKLYVKIKLKKNIPIGAGLGGGSSDAAATLISLNEMFDLKISFKRLSELALELGSDVPFFLKAKPAVGKSRGEILKIKDFEIPYYILVVNPGIHIATKEAFSNIKPKPANIDYETLFNSFDSFVKEKDSVINDFENYVFKKYPEIKTIKEIMLKNNAMFSLMSGSGSTVYGIFANRNDAKKVKDGLPNKYLKIICKPNSN